MQITVVEPSASTAGSFLITAARLAMRPTPIARVIVTTAGRPSGIAATASAIEALNMSTKASPRTSPMTKVTAPRTRMTQSSVVENWAILRVSGVLRSAAPAMSCEILPTSVSSPIATTTPAPVP